MGIWRRLRSGRNGFPTLRHRGLVNGLAIAIFAAGSGLFGPLAGMLIERIGWRATFQVLAGIFFVFTMTGAYLLKDPPEGYVGPAGKAKAAGRPRASQVEMPTSVVLRNPVFMALWVAYALGTTAGTMVISQLVPFARLSGLNAATAAFAITIGAIGSASGRLFSGWMSDHFGRLLTLRAVIVTSMIVTPMLYVWRGDVAALFVLLFFVYYCYGTQISVYTSLAGDFWGTKYLATNYGVLLLAWGFAGVMGPVLGVAGFCEHRELSVRFLWIGWAGLCGTGDFEYGAGAGGSGGGVGAGYRGRLKGGCSQDWPPTSDSWGTSPPRYDNTLIQMLRVRLVAVISLVLSTLPLYGAQYGGSVRAADQFVPGATVTAQQGTARTSPPLRMKMAGTAWISRPASGISGWRCSGSRGRAGRW